MMTMERAHEATRGRAYRDSLAGRPVAVVGLARSGIAAARLLREAGADVVATDAKPLHALTAEARALASLGVRLLDSRTEPLREAELVVVSPGCSCSTASSSPSPGGVACAVIGELELGWRASDAEAVAITGTNGKTTTTALTGALLARQWPACPRRWQHRQPADGRRRVASPARDGSCWRCRASSSRRS